MSSYYGRLFKSANYRLSSNIELWPDEIYRYLSQTHPYLLNYMQGDIDWSEEPVDEELGNGVGAVTVLVGESPIQIPIIVRDFELKPVDMYRAPDGTMDLISPSTVLENVDPRTVDVGLPVDPYTQGVVNKVAGYSQFAKDCDRVMSIVEQEYPKLAASCARIRAQAESRDDGFDAMSIAHNSGTYKLSAFRRGHRIGDYMLDSATVFADPTSKLAEAGRAAKRDGEVIMVARDTNRVALSASTPLGVNLDTYTGSVKMATSDGEMVEGRIVKVAHFTGIEQPMVITKTAYYDRPEKAMQVMEPVQSEHPLTVGDLNKVALSEVKRDASGFLHIGDQLYGPLKVASVFTSQHGERMWSAHTEYGPAEIVISKHAVRCLPAGHGKYLVPEKAEFLPMERLSPSRMSPVDVLREKMASDGDATVEVRSYDGQYTIVVDDVNHNGLSRGEAAACLTSLGFAKTSAMECLDVANRSGTKAAVFYGAEHPVAAHRGEESANPTHRLRIDRFIDRVVDLRPAILKFAADVQSPGLQDDLNAVSLMNQYNATRYADSLDEMEAAKEAIAQILYGIRTDEIDSIDEQTAKDALLAIDQIIRGLNDISASQE